MFVLLLLVICAQDLQCFQQRETYQDEIFNKLMLVGGAGIPQGVEVVDLAAENRICPQMPRFPGASQGSVGTFINGEAIVCTGYATVNCYSFNPITASWDASEITLGTAREDAVGLQLSPNEWWVSGGSDLATSEIYTVDLGFLPYVDLPEVRYSHNMVKINSTHSMLLGDGDEATRKAWMLDRTVSEWQTLPDLLEARVYTHAGLVTYPDGHQAVVVAGGKDQVRSEIFDLTEQTWRYGPDLPEEYQLYAGASVQLENSFLIVGGFDGTFFSSSIYSFDPTIEDWVELPQKLEDGRYFMAAFLIPDHLIECS